MNRNIFSILLLIFLKNIGPVFGQNSSQQVLPKRGWIEMMNDPSVNFYDVQKEFNNSLKKYERRIKKRNISVRGAEELENKMPGFMQYKRWEWFTEPRVSPSGDRSVLSTGRRDARESVSKNSNPAIMQTGNWSLLGPVSTVSTGGGSGRLNCLAIDPTNSNVLFVGSPSGGVWKSTNEGVSWITNTDNLANLGISDIAIDPSNPNIIYVAAGDGNAGDNNSIGILKSVDGGNTWNITSFSYDVSQATQVSRLLIDPANPNILFVASNLGIYRSVDAGVTWVRTFNIGGIKDMEFKPGNSKVIYASGTSFYRSVNGGSTFSSIAGVPTSSRIAIAVTPADSNYVYALASNPSNHSFLGLYRSTNGGFSFVKQSSTPNILGWNADGSDTGGQGWYDLSIAASPADKDEIYAGGVNIWRSSNGGVDWVNKANWLETGSSYVHADIHTLVYLNSGTIYAGCDGGLFRTVNNGNTWTDLSAGLQIAQMYRLGGAATNPNVVIQGWQDNGTNRMNSGTWNQIYGGDGMECFIDRTNENTMYVTLYFGDLKRSFNGGSSWTGITGDITETGAWVTPWCQNPQNPYTIYAGFKNVWKSTNQGDSWTKISSTFSGTLQSLAVAPSDSNYIYAASSNVIQRTSNGGSNWTNIKTGLPAGSMTYIAISGRDPNRAWVTYSGYNSSAKVFKTVNGGATWTNLAYDLPNLPVNCIVVDTTSSVEGIYIGTDLGVYYTDSTRKNWIFFSNGLPNVIVNELEIQYSTGRLRAATYGRGLWETKLHDPGSTAPLANFKGDVLSGCPGHTVQFTDMSTNNPTSWNWRFPGGSPSSSTAQNPVVTYTVAGSYNDVTLSASNAGGSDSINKYSYIAISPGTQPITNPSGNVTVCASNVWVELSVGTKYKWLPDGQASSQLNVASNGTYQCIVTDMFGCADTTPPVNITLQPVIPTPTLTANADTLYCNPSTGYTYQWYLNGSLVPGATQSQITGTGGGAYYVVITSASGCTKQSTTILSDVKEIDLAGIKMGISPSPNNGNFELLCLVEEPKNIFVSILDANGRIIHEKNLGTVSGKRQENFSLQLPVGIYFVRLKTIDGSVMRKFVVK